ncbi:glycosyltransferase family 1 protein [Komagataeibacter rhaeticus]|nr:glycosyltransferase family 1 protein [Komagataeibacter rhaeticus]
MVVSIDPAPYPVAVTIHDLIPLEDPKRYIPAQNDQDAYARRISTVKQADLLIAISDFVAGEVRNRIGVEPEKIITALNGIDHRFTLPKPGSTDHTALLGRLGISRPFVLNTSPLEYRKNLEGLIAAFGSMSRQVRSSHQLVIVGKMNADARPYLDKLVRAEGLPADTLVLTGFVSDEDLVALYAACSLFAFPAWSEGFGLPPLEAMACGAPVISANTTSLPEVVGRADMLVDPSSPLSSDRQWSGSSAIQRFSRTCVRMASSGPRPSHGHAPPGSSFLPLKNCMRSPARASLRSSPSCHSVPALPLVCARMDTDSHVAGRLSGLVSALSAGCDVTLYSMTPDDHLDQWTAAQVECRTLEALDWDASQFDQILYAGIAMTPRCCPPPWPPIPVFSCRCARWNPSMTGRLALPS